MKFCHLFRVNCFVAFVNDKNYNHHCTILFHFFSKNINNATKYHFLIVNYQLLIVNGMQRCHPFRLNCFVAFVNDKNHNHHCTILFHFFSKNTNNATKHHFLIVNYQLLIVNGMQRCHPFRVNCFVAFVNDKNHNHHCTILFHFFSKNINNMTKHPLTIDN